MQVVGTYHIISSATQILSTSYGTLSTLYQISVAAIKHYVLLATVINWNSLVHNSLSNLTVLNWQNNKRLQFLTETIFVAISTLRFL